MRWQSSDIWPMRGGVLKPPAQGPVCSKSGVQNLGDSGTGAGSWRNKQRCLGVGVERGKNKNIVISKVKVIIFKEFKNNCSPKIHHGQARIHGGGECPLAPHWHTRGSPAPRSGIYWQRLKSGVVVKKCKLALICKMVFLLKKYVVKFSCRFTPFFQILPLYFPFI